MTRLFLIGPRGAGKSAAGALAARELGVLFVDADDEIARRAGLRVHEIFALEGERGFRAREREVLLDLLVAAAPDAVIATGGGCVLDPAVRAQLASRPAVVWLQAAVPLLGQRIQGSDRPPLLGGDPVHELVQIVAERNPLYAQACARGAAIDTSALSVDEVAAAIAARWRDLRSGPATGDAPASGR